MPRVVARQVPRAWPRAGWSEGLSDAARYITGQSLTVDGGLTTAWPT